MDFGGNVTRCDLPRAGGSFQLAFALTEPPMENPYSAPRGEILAPTGTQAPLTWKQILFSFEGRIPRRTWWGFSILLNVIAKIVEEVGERAVDQNAAKVVAIAVPLL